MKKSLATIATAALLSFALQLTAGQAYQTNLTFNANPGADHVDAQFKAGFAAGVKWGILSYMQNPQEDDVNFHIREAQAWYWCIVVDQGKTLIERAGIEE